jgi:hypothetical protein
MKLEKQNLIRDLLDEDSNREATMLAGASVLRRRRQWRVARRGAGVLAVVALAAVVVLKMETPRARSPRVPNEALKAPPVSHVQALSDDDLLALFPGTPVALASLPDGRKRLIFPRPGDEEKFVTKL